jgi:hypothetical protein
VKRAVSISVILVMALPLLAVSLVAAASCCPTPCHDAVQTAELPPCCQMRPAPEPAPETELALPPQLGEPAAAAVLAPAGFVAAAKPATVALPTLPPVFFDRPLRI